VGWCDRTGAVADHPSATSPPLSDGEYRFLITAGEFPGWPALLGHLADHEDLSEQQAQAAMSQILAGSATDAQIAAFIVGLRIKGETAEEILGLSDAMLEVAAPLNLADGTVDIVGTGGSHTLRNRAFNVSTISSIVAAAAGATVCKHGNRKASSTSGSVDVLEQLGVAVELDGPGVERCIAEANVGFAFARVFHPAMRFVAGVRSELGIPTVFNILGPLSHPGRVRRQLLGVADRSRMDIVAEVLAARGVDRALVVHGLDGLDEITTTGHTTVIEIRGHTIERYDVTPTDLGLPVRTVDEVAVGDPAQNAAVARDMLAGKPGAHREIVTLNAGAALYVSDLATSIAEGVAKASEALDSGAAAATLDRLVAASQAAASNAG